ncbi:MAG: LOG family protein [Phycisphaerales bacterium]|nr:LOG family protein [Phycisphaerales bacterium]
MKTPVVSVFGSSAPQPGSDAYIAAFELGRLIAKQGWTICNGGYGGTMEAAARGAATAGGLTIGVTCSGFGPRPANRYVRRRIRTTNLFDRLKTLIRSASAYVVLPGGTGTLVELSLVLEFANKRMLTGNRPLIFLGDYWRGVVEAATRERPLLQNVHFCATPADTVSVLCNHFGPKAAPARRRAAARKRTPA